MDESQLILTGFYLQNDTEKLTEKCPMKGPRYDQEPGAPLPRWETVRTVEVALGVPNCAGGWIRWFPDFPSQHNHSAKYFLQ